MRRVSWLVLLFAASTGWSAEEAAPSALKPANVVDPGHSSHGEAFNEGPRRAAYLMGTTGNVSFAITSKHAQSQAFFNQGLGQLHGFWYFEAERSFRQICALDHSCAMAYWGMALANVKEVAPRGSARGALRPELNLPVGLLAALLAELHERFFGFNAATMCSADQEPKATLQRPRAVEAKPLRRLRERRMAKFFDVRRLCFPFPLFLLSPMPSCRGWKPSLS